MNVATGSKIQAIACMMACMIFNERKNVRPFYARAQSYAGFDGTQQSTGVKELIPLPAYDIHIPRQELIQALNIIKDHGGRISKKVLAELAEKNNLINVNAREENFEQARFASLDKNIIQPLQDEWEFVEVEKIGRTRWVKITKDGINASEFLT